MTLAVVGTGVSLVGLVAALALMGLLIMFRRAASDFVVGLWNRDTPQREVGTPIPHMLTPAEIRVALAGRIEKSPNPVKKKSKLQEALELYQQHGLEPLYLHKCLVAFKESLAYSGREFFDDPEDGDKYKAVLNELIKVVQERYRNACILEKAKDWKRAEREFGSLLLIVPDRSNPIFANVEEHYKRVQGILQKEEAKKERSPLSQ